MMTLEETEVAKTLADGIVGLSSSEPTNDEFVKFGWSGAAFEQDISASSSVHVVSKEDESNIGLGLELGLGLGCGGGKEEVKRMDSVFGVAKNEENDIDKLASANSSVVSFGDYTDRKAALDENNSMSIEEFHGPSEMGNENEKRLSNGDDEGSLTGNGGGPNGKSIKTPSSTSKVEEHEMNDNGEEIEEDVTSDNNEDDDGEDAGDQEHHAYSVGDFVWGKIRSHPWWPGLIYDSSDASEFVAKYRRKGRHLVAYFGDCTFSWCPPSQLKHFSRNFEQMSKQSNSKNFVYAVQEAVDEFGRRVELEMTCSCLPEESMVSLNRPLAVNAGLKSGTLVAEGGDKNMNYQYEPIEVLGYLRNLAHRPLSIRSMLELKVLKSWLSVLSAKQNQPLCIYHEPRFIEGLEEKKRIEIANTNDFSFPVQVPIQGPFEEGWLGSPGSRGKCQKMSDDKLSHKRKQKSVAELMKDDMNKGRSVKKGTPSGSSISEKKKEKGSDDNHTACTLTDSGEKRQRKREALSYGSSDAKKKKTESVKIFSGGGKTAASDSPLSYEQKGSSISGKKHGSGKDSDDLDNMSPRERKQSKYLSPPYTSLKHKVKDLEKETEKITSDTKMGERMMKAVGQLVGSSPISRCSSKAFNENPSKQLSGSNCKYGSGSLALQTSEQDQQRIANHNEVNASVNEMLSEVLSTAVSPQYLREKRLLDMVRGFICAFRTSLHVNGPNYFLHHEHLPGGKRKSSIPEPEPLGIDLNQTDEEPQLLSQLTGIEKKKKVKADASKIKQAAKAFQLRENVEESDQNTSTATLIVTFSNSYSMPLKADLINIFSKFGALNDKETEVFDSSHSAHVVFQRTSDAEAAFEKSVKDNPFGTSNVNYSLKSSSNHRSDSAPKKTSEDVASSRQSDSGVSQVCFIRQKLEMMLSMLENCDDVSLHVKSALEGEMKALLEKISYVA